MITNTYTDLFLVNSSQLGKNGTAIADAYLILNIEDSTITSQGANGQQHTMFQMGGKEVVAEVNIKGNSKLTLNGDANTAAQGAHIIGTTQSNANEKITVNLEKGVELVMDLKAPSLSGFCSFFYSKAANTSIILNDGGAVYKISAASQKLGVMTPTLSNTNLLGWAVNGALYKGVTSGVSESLVKDENATGEIAIYPVFFDIENGFVMVNGASIRTDDPTDIRFTTKVSADLIHALTEAGVTAEFGTYITLTSKLQALNVDFETFLNIYPATVRPEENGTEWVKVVSTKWAVENGDDGMNEFRTCLYDIPENGYATAISAMSYFTVTYANGETATYYTAYNEENNSRSMYDVAQSAIAAGEGNAFLQGIVDACAEA